VTSSSPKPYTDTERRVAGVWKEVLRLPEVDVHDDFFALGGSSMALITMLNRVCQEFGMEGSLEELVLEATSVSALAAQIDALSASNSADR
jgi:acyl carrier protein